MPRDRAANSSSPFSKSSRSFAQLSSGEVEKDRLERRDLLHHHHFTLVADRRAHELVLRAAGDDFSVIDDRNSIAQTLRFLHVVCGVDQRYAAYFESFDHL